MHFQHLAVEQFLRSTPSIIVLDSSLNFDADKFDQRLIRDCLVYLSPIKRSRSRRLKTECLVFELWGASFSSCRVLRFRLRVLHFRLRVLRFRVSGCLVLRSSFSSASFSILPTCDNHRRNE